MFLSRTSRFCLTIFEEIRNFLPLSSFFPDGCHLLPPILKKSEFFVSTQFLSRTTLFFLVSLKKICFFICILGHRCIQRIVHMQKIRNLSGFIRYISKKSEISTAFLKKSATSGIFPEFLKTFTLFRTFFKKSFSGILRQTEYRYLSNIPCANSPNSPKLPSTGVISKICPGCAVVSRKNLKKHHFYTTDYQDCPPILSHPFSTFFKKNLSLHWRLSQKLHEKVTPAVTFS